MIRIILTLFVVLLNTSVLFGVDHGRWIACAGEAAVQNMTMEEARNLAIKRARLDAIEKVCGVQLQSESLVQNFMLSGDFIHSVASGNVVEEKDKSWTTETISPENPSDPPVILLKLTMKARVVRNDEKPDPGFKISVALNKENFITGDEVLFTIKSTRDCYLTILNLAANDSVYVLFPNLFQKDTFIGGGVKMQFPRDEDRTSGLAIRVSNLPGHKKDTEYVKIIATKQKMSLPGDLFDAKGFGLMGTPKIAGMELARWLAEIPLNERAEANIAYTVYAR